MCLRTTIFAHILKLTVQIAFIFSQFYQDRGAAFEALLALKLTNFKAVQADFSKIYLGTF